MRTLEIKVGKIYETRTGFKREVLSITNADFAVSWRKVRFLALDGTDAGLTHTIDLRSFANWARSEVKEG